MADAVRRDGLAEPHWIERLDHPDDDVRWRAIDALRHIVRPEQAVPLFVAALQGDRDWHVCALAAHAVYDLAFEEHHWPILRGAIIPLAEALEDKSLDVALNAAYALERLGPIASAAIPALRRAVGRGDDRLRIAARDALAAVAFGDAP